MEPTFSQSDQEILDLELDFASQMVKRTKKLSHIDGYNRLLRKVVSEQNFLSSLQGQQYCGERLSLQLRSSNLPSLEAVLLVAESCSNVSNLLLPVKTLPQEDNKDGRQRNVKLNVDVVADSGLTWYKVFARNPLSIHQIWEGNCQYGEKSIITVAESYKAASCGNMVRFKSPSVVFAFAAGVTEPVAADLKSRGVNVVGNVMPLDSMSALVKDDNVFIPSCYRFSKLWFKPILHEYDDNTADQRVNLDVTTLVAIVSSVTNEDTSCRYSGDFLQSHVEEEKSHRVLPVINDFIKGKTILVCRTALEDFQSIIDTIGGSKEKKRAQLFFETVTVVDDHCSNPNLKLHCSGRIKQRALTIFATGEHYKAVTVSANTAFVRAAQSQGFDPNVFLHASRALGERKKIVEE